jgi:hypothetical protein
MTGRRQRCADPGAPCHLVQRDRLNVSVARADANAALRRTQERMHDVAQVSGLPELGRTLERLRGCAIPRGERSLDLIAHANAAGVLVLGSSLLAPDDRELAAFARDHRDALAGLGFTRVRLLGCYTGVDEPARRALAHVRDALALPVFGWPEFLDESFFDVDGLSRKWEGRLVLG